MDASSFVAVAEIFNLATYDLGVEHTVVIPLEEKWARCQVLVVARSSPKQRGFAWQRVRRRLPTLLSNGAHPLAPVPFPLTFCRTFHYTPGI